jgi:hypothetical protein
MSERVAELRAAIAERDTERVPTVTLTCSSCGRVDAITGPDLDDLETEFAYWQIDDERPYFDYCPDCSESASDTPASDEERGRSRRPTKFIVFRVTYDDGHEKTSRFRRRTGPLAITGPSTSPGGVSKSHGSSSWK